MGRFYLEPLPRCHVCGKPASDVVFRSGKVRYRFACPRHGESQVRELERVHAKYDAENAAANATTEATP